MQRIKVKIMKLNMQLHIHTELIECPLLFPGNYSAYDMPNISMSSKSTIYLFMVMKLKNRHLCNIDYKNMFNELVNMQLIRQCSFLNTSTILKPIYEAPIASFSCKLYHIFSVK